MKSFLSCALCHSLPEGHGILSVEDGDMARRDELRVLYSADFERLLECPECGTLYELQITPIDTGWWETFVDPYDVPTDPHESMARLAPSRGEQLLAQHAPERLPDWHEHVERHLALFARALESTKAPLGAERLQHAVAFQIDRATREDLIALLSHGDLRIVLHTAQTILYPRVSDPRFARQVTSRLKEWLPALKEPLSHALSRCIASDLGPQALELADYAREHLNAEVLSAATGKRALKREHIAERLLAPALSDRLDAIHDLLMNLDAEYDHKSSSAFGRARPEIAQRFADSLLAGLADPATRRRAVGIVQQWTIADRHIELFRPVLPALAALLTDDAVMTFAEDALLFHFAFYDEPTRQALRKLLGSSDGSTVAAARKVIESWGYQLRSAKRPAEAEQLASDLKNPI